MNRMMEKVLAFILLISVVSLSGCFKEEWDGFVYPDKNDLTIHKEIGVYASLKLCRAAAQEMLENLNAIDKGDYECGLNCESREGWDTVKVCKKTER